MSPRIAIYKYGVGNVFSVKSAVERVGGRARILESLEDLREFDSLILPGVGTMPAAMRRLTKYRRELERHVESGKPVLGICLGLQVMFEASTELGYTQGLGVFRGLVERLDSRPLPHIGWSLVEPRRRSAILEGLEEPFHAYFIHSYAHKDVSEVFVAAVTRRGGEEFTAVAEKHPYYGTQFHPERSGARGLKVLANFVGISR